MAVSRPPPARPAKPPPSFVQREIGPLEPVFRQSNVRLSCVSEFGNPAVLFGAFVVTTRPHEHHSAFRGGDQAGTLSRLLVQVVERTPESAGSPRFTWDAVLLPCHVGAGERAASSGHHLRIRGHINEGARSGCCHERLHTGRNENRAERVVAEERTSAARLRMAARAYGEAQSGILPLRLRGHFTKRHRGINNLTGDFRECPVRSERRSRIRLSPLSPCRRAGWAGRPALGRLTRPYFLGSGAKEPDQAVPFGGII